MLRRGDVLDLSPIGAVFHVRKTAEDTDGRSFEMEWELAPHSGGTPVHIHPHATESYEVIEGELDLYVNGTWRRLSAGAKVSVDAGIAHTFRNPTAATVRVYNSHAPAMRFGEYFEGLHRIVSSGAISAERMTPKAILYLSLLMTSFESEIRSVKPPYAVMKVFSLVARLLGYQVPTRESV